MKSSNYQLIKEFFIDKLNLSIENFSDLDFYGEYYFEDLNIASFLDEEELKIFNRVKEITKSYSENKISYSKYKEIIKNENLSSFSQLFRNMCLKHGFDFELVDERGGEDQGVVWYKVFYFKNLDTYLKINGSYYSYSGVSFADDFEEAVEEVKPVEKLIIDYEPI